MQVLWVFVVYAERIQADHWSTISSLQSTLIMFGTLFTAQNKPPCGTYMHKLTDSINLTNTDTLACPIRRKSNGVRLTLKHFSLQKWFQIIVCKLLTKIHGLIKHSSNILMLDRCLKVFISIRICLLFRISCTACFFYYFQVGLIGLIVKNMLLNLKPYS